MTDAHWDVVVIGGGIAGASAAYELAEATEVLLLDMEKSLGHHATGRSAAMFLETYGGTDVRAFTTASRAFLEDPPDAFEARLLTPRALLQFARPGRLDALRDLCRDVGDVVDSVEMLDEASTRALCPIVREGVVEGALHEPGAMELDVDALHQGYVRGFRRRGGTVQRGARVESIVPDAQGWSIRLDDGTSVGARTVVNAAGAWVDQVAAAAGVRPLGFVPRLRSAFMTAAPDGIAMDRLPMLYDVDESFYVKPEGDQMLCSPADRTVSDPVDARPDTLEIARALDEIRDITTVPARSVRSSWAGLRTFSPDENLVIGPDPRADGFFWLAGQAGYGVQTAPAVGRYVAALVLGHAVDDELSTHGLSPDRISPARFDGPPR